MSKGRLKKGSFDRNDALRTLLTDTLPGDIPVIVDNVGLRQNIKDLPTSSTVLKNIVEKCVVANECPYTIPYRFKIARGTLGFRQLSLLHPAAELSVAIFYQKYDHIITYYGSLSRMSLRYASKVGSSFYYKNPYADINKYKEQDIDLESRERHIKYPSSYFSYGGIKRYYKYFSSNEFISFEKKYATMALLDISKCFSSLYTHTITWAVKDRDKGKDHPRASSFGNEFDRIMQRMNYNETNGIVVGPEVSRIFAEIILQSIDLKLERDLTKSGFILGENYECRRYVDDYIIFTHDSNSANHIIRVLENCLSELNLGLNSEKTYFFPRPFQTRMSSVTDAVLEVTNQFWSSRVSVLDEKRHSMAKPIFSAQDVSFSYIKSIKKACYENNATYEQVTGIIISAIDIRIQYLIHSIDEEENPSADQIGNQISLLSCLLDISFFFFNVNPKVESAPKLTRDVILAYRFTRKYAHPLLGVISERIVEWCTDSLEALVRHGVHENNYTPAELLNVLLCLSELEPEYFYTCKPFIEKVLEAHKDDYFTIVTVLFLVKNKIEFGDIRKQIEDNISNTILKSLRPRMCSKDFHLAMDLLSCPYLSDTFRDKLLHVLLDRTEIAVPGKAKRKSLLTEIEGRPWFVRWGQIDLLKALEKAELNSVY